MAVDVDDAIAKVVAGVVVVVEVAACFLSLFVPWAAVAVAAAAMAEVEAGGGRAPAGFQ